MSKIGIDVGGTNTDAVLVRETEVLASVKTSTTEDVISGITAALAHLLADPAADPGAVEAVMIGTTHFTNAVVQRRGLTPTAAVRIGLPASASLEPFVDWPQDLAAQVNAGHYMIEGGHEVDGRPIVAFDTKAMGEAARKIRDTGVRSVGISSIFSPLNAECELEAAEILRAECPDVAITLSHELGRIGLLERENVTLLNAALVELARRTTGSYVKALDESGIKAPLYLTQNDGTIMRSAYAAAFPVFSFASGPTNSMRGAAFLSSLDDAIVVDVGGTTTDIGCLKHGFPREANNVVEVGGVRTNFRMPDVLSVGLGGGSIVRREPLSVGPVSVGYELTERALAFGGDTLTASDIGVAAGLVEFGDRKRLSGLDGGLVKRALALIHTMIEESVDRMKPDATAMPLIAVGGGSFLIPEQIAGISEVINVEHQSVANAVGAAIAQVSGEVDQIFQDLPREEAIGRAKQMAVERAVRAGADPATIKTVEIEDLPLSYLPGNSLRTRVRVVGDIASGGGSP